MESAITFCNHNSLAFSLSRNPSSSTKHAAATKIASLSSKSPNQLLNCSALSSASLTKKSPVFHVQHNSYGGSVRCSVAESTAATPSGM